MLEDTATVSCTCICASCRKSLIIEHNLLTQQVTKWFRCHHCGASNVLSIKTAVAAEKFSTDVPMSTGLED